MMSFSSEISRPIQYQLNVQLVGQTCLFELRWGQGQQLTAQLQYPMRLSTLYRQWRFAYLTFYQNLCLDRSFPEDGTDSTHKIINPLRGEVADIGSLESPSLDWHTSLVTVEAKLLSEFHNWLRSGELYQIRSELLQTFVVSSEPSSRVPESIVDLWVVCGSSELAQLPWETWEIGTDLVANGRIRIFRAPPTITLIPLRGKSRARVLVILGDETGLEFKKEREALVRCQKQLELKFVGWTPGKSIAQLKDEIRQALTDAEGWDVLLFFGHSNETDHTGGVIAIAPDAYIQLQEIARDLKIAKERGLQFALFNSCHGLSIADFLIDLGLSQVAVMREAIHNAVAQEFLVQFLQKLANYKDAADALRSACEFLKVKQNLTYPSAYLIPSLFRHPGADVFRLQPKRRWWQRAITLLRPKPVESIALPALLWLSLNLSVQDGLVARRLLVQSIYRDYTGQINPTATPEPPPVLLVQIDQESLGKAKIAPLPRMDRKYVAQIVDRLAALEAPIIGLDLLFEQTAKEEKNTPLLTRSLHNAVSNHQTWLVLAAHKYNRQWLTPIPEIASSHWSTFGDIELLLWAMKLAPQDLASTSILPFSYHLALADRLHKMFPEALPQPNLKSSEDWLTQINQFIKSQGIQDYTTLLPHWSRRQGITRWSYKLHQRWFHPIIDFSIPPAHAYQTIPVWQLLESDANSPQLQNLKQQVVIVAAGGFLGAGLSPNEDNHKLPSAIAYWYDHTANPTEIFTGGEAHAYMTHHLLRDRLVIPIPDLWVLGLAILLGKGIATAWQKQRHSYGTLGISIAQGTVVLVPILYGVASLQLFIGAAILVPWVLPSTAFWIYALPILQRKKTV